MWSLRYFNGQFFVSLTEFTVSFNSFLCSFVIFCLCTWHSCDIAYEMSGHELCEMKSSWPRILTNTSLLYSVFLIVVRRSMCWFWVSVTIPMELWIRNPEKCNWNFVLLHVTNVLVALCSCVWYCCVPVFSESSVAKPLSQWSGYYYAIKKAGVKGCWAHFQLSWQYRVIIIEETRAWLDKAIVRKLDFGDIVRWQFCFRGRKCEDVSLKWQRLHIGLLDVACPDNSVK